MNTIKNASFVARNASRLRMLATAVVIAFATTATSASALTLDTAETLAIVGVVLAFITTIGLAVLGLHMTVKGISWARKVG